jgi:acyl-CoA hydrolase
MRHSRSEAVTASMDSVAFLSRVQLGDVLLLRGRLNAAFRSSMEVEVIVHAEDPRTGARRLTTTALVTMVAVDETGAIAAVPPLEARDDDDRRRAAEAAARRSARLASRTTSPPSS